MESKFNCVCYTKWKYTNQKLVEMHQLIRKTKGALFLQCMGICTVECNGTSRVRNPMNYRSSIDFFPNNNNTIKVLKQQWATTLVISDFGTGEHYLWAVSVREDGSNTLYIRFFSPGELTRLTQDSILLAFVIIVYPIRIKLINVSKMREKIFQMCSCCCFKK